ncbi:MAG TPA: DNA primase, partial [Verrucomicrobiae bacterium]|nr:DNA primase [Verrucomicrobiae bacterium]
ITTDKGRNIIVRDMAEAVRKTGSAVLVDKYAQKTALRLGVSTESVRAEFKKIPIAKIPSAENETDSFENAGQSEPTRPSPLEFHLLKLLLLHDELVSQAALHLDLNWILNLLAQQIILQRLASQANETWKNLAAFLDECASPEMRNLVTEIAAEDRKIPNPETQLADVILKLRNQFLDRQIVALTQKAGQPEIADSEKMELLHAQKELREQKRAPLSQLKN